MSNRSKDSTWDPEDIELLDDFEESRNLALRATKQLFLDFYNKNFQGDEKVLEIGSGTGFLKRNWSENFHGEWIQMDSQPAFLKEAKKKSNGTYIQGSAYRIPFPDESLDVVCGYGSYDVFMDLENATKEASRVLKKDGLFFHMLDLDPCSSPIANDLEKKGIPLRTKGKYEKPEGVCQVKSISFISEEKMEEFEKMCANLNGNCSNLSDFGGKYNKVWKKYSEEIKTHDYFDKKLRQSLMSYFDPETIENGNLTSSFKGKRTEQQQKLDKEPFLFFNEAGKFYRYSNSTQYNMLQSNFPNMLNVLPAGHDCAYRILKQISPSLAQKIEPSCSEISAVKYVSARK
ncbi:MAG: class I SAM-dependent methyltransferase [Candidatus Aenigmarchaeota archaeon]|nr:class I SAM-dependent methyltransferase [Candidatus Aenigmarchaeota archaeon]